MSSYLILLVFVLNIIIQQTSSSSTYNSSNSSLSSSLSPTRYPTNTYWFIDEWIDIVYDIKHLTKYDMQTVATNIFQVLEDINIIIEESYALAAELSRSKLEYQHFQIIF